jgi:hypothetical protein
MTWNSGPQAVIAGQELVVDPRVDGDLNAAGESLDLRGSITDDLRAAGRVLTLNLGTKEGLRVDPLNSWR